MRNIILYFGILILGIHFCWITPAIAQDLQSEFRSQHESFLRLATGEDKDIEFRYLLEPRHDLVSASESSVMLNEFLFDAEVPVILSRDSFLRIKTTYDARVYDLHRLTLFDQRVNSATLHKAQIGLGAGYFINPDFMATAMVTPGVFSNFGRSLTQDQTDLYGEGFLLYRLQSNVQLIGGAITDQVFDKVRVYPVIAARWRSPDEKVHVKFTPPVAARVAYSFSPKFVAYSAFSLTGDRYRVHLNEADVDFNLRVQDKRLGIGLQYFIDKHWNISLESGASISNRFEIKLKQSELPPDHTDTTVYSFASLGYML